MGYRFAILGPVLNYVLFFRGAFVQNFKSRQRRAKFDTERKKRDSEALHTCDACGASDRSHPEREFRYRTIDGEAKCLCSVCREQLD
jgi:hypothetical protein